MSATKLLGRPPFPLSSFPLNSFNSKLYECLYHTLKLKARFGDPYMSAPFCLFLLRIYFPYSLLHRYTKKFTNDKFSLTFATLKARH